MESEELKEVIFTDGNYSFNGMEKSDDKERTLIEALKFFSPGTAIRTALDDLMRARMGALIVIESEGVLELVEGGFKIDSKFSAQKLVELSKMDGAIIISSDFKKILFANTLLVPDAKLSTRETGTRHKAAERTSKQTGAMVIAVSERKNKITLYLEDFKYVLENSSEILRRAIESLQILEKQKEIFDDLMIDLNILELNGLVTISDVCNVLQRMEIIKRISDRIRRYLVELGKEGIIVSMRLKDLTKHLSRERNFILQDYFESFLEANLKLNMMDFDSLLDLNSVSQELFEEVHDEKIFSKGQRLLNKTNLSEGDIDLVVKSSLSLKEVFEREKDSLGQILNNEGLVESFIKDLENLREKILVGKKI